MFENFDITRFMSEAARVRVSSGKGHSLRHSKLELEDIARFLMQPRTETTEVEKQVFLELIHKNVDVTKEDIIERRTLLSWTSFRDFNLELSSRCYSGDFPMTNRRPILAFDGTMISLQQTPDLLEEFGGIQSRGTPLSRSEILCDTETETIIDAEFGKFRSDEGSMALTILNRLPKSLIAKHPIALFDRKYCGFRTMYACKRNGVDFVLRVKRNFSKTTDDFFSSGKKTGHEVLTPTDQSVRRHKRRYPDEPFGAPVEVWLCRSFDGDEPVVLMSSFPLSEERGLALYPLRWKAESVIDSLKNLFEIEIFSGHRPEVVRQDFYARLIPYNIFYLCLHAAALLRLKQQKVEDSRKTREHKYAYRLNANASLHRFKEVFPGLCYAENAEVTIQRRCRSVRP